MLVALQWVCPTDVWNKWIATIAVDGRQINLGRFTTEQAAANAYAAAAVQYHGDFAAPRVELTADPATPAAPAGPRSPRKRGRTSSRCPGA